MASSQQDGGKQTNGGGTPSTASRVKDAPLECVFPTPTPKREVSRSSAPGRCSPSIPKPMIFPPKSSPAPRQHKSVEVLGTNAKGNHLANSGALELEKQYLRREVSKKNSQHFDQVFAVRESYHSAKARVYRDSMVVLELQMNCHVEEAQDFLNDFLQNISETYHRPINNIMITITTEGEIMMGGSTEPAYLLTISALPSEIAATKNMRSTFLIQSFLAQQLQIPKERGVIRFHAIKEEDLATNGMTILQEIEKAEQEATDERRGLSMRSRQSNRASRRSQLPTTSEAKEMEYSRSDTPILSPEGYYEKEDDERKIPIWSNFSAGKIKSRKSIMTFWKR